MTSSKSLPTLFAACLVAACARPPAELTLRGATMGTSYTVRVARAGLAPAEKTALKIDIDAALARVNKLMSTYDPGSELSRFNRRESTAPFRVSPATLRVAEAALRVAADTGGAFDPTVGPLVDLWGFGPAERTGAPPSEAALAQARAVTGFKRLHAISRPPALRKDLGGLRVDLSAIAKGYGVDVVAGLLDKRGHENFMVEIGGEVFTRGRNQQGKPWRIGVDRPVDNAAPGHALSAAFALSGAGLATSGGYRNFFIKDGKRYSHFIDPRSGRPVQGDLASVTVIAPTCMEADAAATAVMVMGLKAGRAWIEEHRDWEALFITARPGGKFAQTATRGFPDRNLYP